MEHSVACETVTNQHQVKSVTGCYNIIAWETQYFSATKINELMLFRKRATL
jgi:hypothetical protein